MPVITINNPKSPAYGRLAAWFDTDKPRKAPKAEKQLSLKRQNDHRREVGEKPIRQSGIDSYHHLNGDRATPDAENLFGCKSSEQHNHIELQMQEWFTQLFNMGKIGFDYFTKKYFLADERLENEVREWIDKGSPKQWDIRGLHQSSDLKALHTR